MIKHIFTDGATSNNGYSNAIAGIGVYFGEDDERNVSEKLLDPIQTNNRAELTAIFKALSLLVETEDLSKTSFVLYTDSIYCIKSLTVWIEKWKLNDWKTSKKQFVKNKDLLEKISALMLQFTDLRFNHVKAHTGKKDDISLGNFYADKLATNSIINSSV